LVAGGDGGAASVAGALPARIVATAAAVTAMNSLGACSLTFSRGADDRHCEVTIRCHAHRCERLAGAGPGERPGWKVVCRPGFTLNS